MKSQEKTLKLKNRYLLLRHGQTIYQTKKKEFIYPAFPEKPAVKLTKKGEKQIKAAAQKLKKAGIDLIFSSDFFRTRQTAKIIAKELGIEKINLAKRLRDVNLGAYHGNKKIKLYQAFPIVKARFKKRIPEGESWFDCQKRMAEFLKDIDKKFRGKRILIVSHGDPLWLLEGAMKKWSLEKLLKIKSGKKGIIKTGELRKF